MLHSTRTRTQERGVAMSATNLLLLISRAYLTVHGTARPLVERSTCLLLHTQPNGGKSIYLAVH